VTDHTIYRPESSSSDYRPDEEANALTRDCGSTKGEFPKQLDQPKKQTRDCGWVKTEFPKSLIRPRNNRVTVTLSPCSIRTQTSPDDDSDYICSSHPVSSCFLQPLKSQTPSSPCVNVAVLKLNFQKRFIRPRYKRQSQQP